MSQRISFVDDDDDLTFVNYGTGSDYTYRREARIHNAQRGLRRANRVQSAAAEARSQRDIGRRGIARQPQPDESVATSLAGVAAPSGPVAPGLSSYDFNSPPRSLEAVWRSIFPAYFYLPRLSTSTTILPDPENTFLAAAQSSEYAYRNLFVLTAISAEARRGATAAEDVFRNQAQIIQEFREMVQRHTELGTRLTRQDLQNIFAAAFSFFGRDFGKEPAYNAIMFINSTLMHLPQNRSLKLLPTAEWIRLLLPRPGDSFNRTQSYQSLMLKKANSLLDFLETTRSNFTNGLTASLAHYFRPSTAIHQIITTPPDQTAAGPYPGFYLMCCHRILFLLHTHINERVQASLTDADAFLATMETVASACLVHAPAQRLALFLWGLLVNSDAYDTCRDPHEQCYIWAMKDLFHVFNWDIARDMANWLPQDSQDIRDDVTWLDIDAMREAVRAHYEPNGPSGLVDPYGMASWLEGSS